MEDDRDAETIADIRRFRAEFELPTDEALIDYFLREHHADRMPMPGMWLTPNEAELHSRHEELIERARQATQPYVERHRADVAGSWVDIPRGERHIAFARDVERHRAALEALAPDPGVLVVHAHERTEAELEALMERVIDDGDELRQLGLDVLAVAYDEESNVVEVEVEASDAETAQRVLSERYGDVVRAEWFPPDTD